MKAVGLALVLALGSACSTSQLNQARQGIVAGIHVFSTGSQALEAARQAEEDSLLKRVDAKQLTADAAEAEYRSWMARGQKAVTALVTLWDAIKSAASVVAALDSKLAGDLPGASAAIVSALANAAAALADIGVRI